MRFRVASILSQYVGDRKIIEIEQVSTLKEAIAELEHQYPGIKFRFIDELGRIRPHMNIFVNKELIRSLDTPLNHEDEVFIVQSISGG